MDKILTSKILLSPNGIAKSIAKNAQKCRLQLNISQEQLAQKSGVSLGSVKRFENKYEISLKNLLKIAFILNSTDEFEILFTKKQYMSINDVVKATKTYKRAGRTK
jgi:transcriptional regulator with XRE-family HTH domain